MSSTIEHATEQLGRAASALASVSGDVKTASRLLALLGWAPPPGADDIGLAQLDLSTVVARLDALTALRRQPGTSDADIAVAVAAVVAAVADSLDDFEGIVDGFQASQEYLQATGIRGEFFARLTDLLVIHAVASVTPVAASVGALLGIFEFTHLPANPATYQIDHVRQKVHWDRLPTLLTDPAKLLKDVYGWGTADFKGNALVANIGRVVEYIAADARLRPLPRAAEERLVGRPVPEADTNPAAQLFVSLDKGVGLNAFDAGLTVYPLRSTTTGGTDAGIGVSPYVFGTTDTTFPLSDTLSLVVSASAALQGGLALLLRAGRDPQVKAGLIDGNSTPTGQVSMMLRSADPNGGRSTLFTAPNVVVDAAAVSAGIGMSLGAGLNPSINLKIEDGRVHVASDDADSFLASILPEDGLTANLDLEVGWSHRDGVRVTGGAGLSTTIDLHKTVGPLRLDSLDVAVKAAPDGVTGSVGFSGGASIGPVTAVATGMGAAVALKFARGNLGPVDLSAKFKPPTGIGLSVQASGVLTGGGFLFHDAAQHLYAGVMQLTFQEQLTLKAFGLIATRMPDGSRGYSMVIFITAEDFRPVPLGLGFTLLGIGGMIGVNRTFDQEVLRQGLKTGTLATLLFPRDPVGNAPTLIRTLATAFPARRGSYLLGLVAKLGWFQPLVMMDLALILEFGARQRLLALGRITALLPSPDNDLVRLNMEAMGVLDFDARTAAIDAVLVDSRLVHKFPITGAAALRAGAGDGPSFVLSVGGFNPRFSPPASVPALDRVAIALSAGSNPRLLCEAYFAVTSNSVQFGARAALYAAAAGFSVEGDIGFDVLLQLAPLHFIADFHARLQLKRGSHSLFMVALAGELEGPRPLRVSGKATFSILWCDLSVRFDTTLVSGERPPLPPAVDLSSQLIEALRAPSSWSTERSTTQNHGVALRSLAPAAAGAPIALDPLGQLVVRQQVVPLNTARDIDTFGGAPVSGPRRFTVGATLQGTAMTRSPRQAPFAPAQYFSMSDDEKLEAPSFEPMDAGYVFGDATTAFDTTQVVAAPLTYQSITITLPNAPQPLARTMVEVEEPEPMLVGATSGRISPKRPTEPTSPRPVEVTTVAPGAYTLSAAQLQTLARSGAAGRAPVRRVGRARFRNTAVAPAATVVEPAWTIRSNGDEPAPAADPNLRTWSEHHAALKALNRARARWQLVPVHELEA